MTKFRTAIFGDTGYDIIERSVSTLESALPDAFESSDAAIAHEELTRADIPSGGRLLHNALKSLLGDTRFIFDYDFYKSPLPQYIWLLREFNWLGQGNVLRISGQDPVKVHRGAVVKCPPSKEAGENGEPHQAVVIHDATGSWRTNSGEKTKVMESINAMNTDSEGPNVFVNIGWRVPDLSEHDGNISVGRDRGRDRGREASPIWQALYNKCRKRTAIILSASDLRHAGAAISRRLSWEQSIEDTMSELKRFEPLRVLSLFGHVIIRFGFVGVLHIWRKDRECGATFSFMPKADNGVFRSEYRDGRINGRGAAIIASLINQMQKDTILTTQGIAKAIQTSIVTIMRIFDAGFPIPSESTSILTAYHTKYMDSLFSDSSNYPITESPSDIIRIGYDKVSAEIGDSSNRLVGTIYIPAKVVNTSPASRRNWRILESQVCGQSDMSRINVGLAISKYGHDHVLNCDLVANLKESKASKDIHRILQLPECQFDDEDLDDFVGEPQRPSSTTKLYSAKNKVKNLYVPVMRFGRLIATERDVIESLRGIHNLMRSYIQRETSHPHSNKPLSIAVFGPPGSGKSFAVKQIAENMGPVENSIKSPLKALECNVAQFRSSDDLETVISRIASINNNGKIPLVFFDEFDCKKNGQELGWLKYFLGPMQDGTFYGAKSTIVFGRAIFVFAGGINTTISEFDPFSPQSDKKGNDPRVKQESFLEQKGPDFISRLRGHINIQSVNSDKAKASKPRAKHIIRRSIILRGLIEQSPGLIAKRGEFDVAQIDEDILYALLTVDEYRHEARSMEAILHMCNSLRGRIEKTSLPSRSQLNMHVNSDEFMTRIERGRFRHTFNYYYPEDKDGSDSTSGTGTPGSGERTFGLKVGDPASETQSKH